MKVLLVDDHKLMRDGLRALLERASARVCGEAGNGFEALELAQALQPDVVSMDIASTHTRLQARQARPTSGFEGCSVRHARRHRIVGDVCSFGSTCAQGGYRLPSSRLGTTPD